jgi:hypothetical protein
MPVHAAACIVVPSAFDSAGYQLRVLASNQRCWQFAVHAIMEGAAVHEWRVCWGVLVPQTHCNSDIGLGTALLLFGVLCLDCA